MPKFTVAELAKKYGIARTSIYDRMKNGSISYEIDAKNRKVIDFSEMQRVYGTPDSKAYSQPDSTQTDNTTIELYKQLIEELRHDKSVAEERERRMYKEIDQLKDKIDSLTLSLGYTPKRFSLTVSLTVGMNKPVQPQTYKKSYILNKFNLSKINPFNKRLRYNQNLKSEAYLVEFYRLF